MKLVKKIVDKLFLFQKLYVYMAKSCRTIKNNVNYDIR